MTLWLMMAGVACAWAGARETAAAAGDDAPVVADPVAIPQDDELRGVWLTRFDYAGRTADELRQTLDDIADAGFNAVFFQVRGTFDAWYSSRLEPWAAPLSGRLGGDPGWDPLAVAVEAAHARGMQLHAYINVTPLWRGEEAPDSVGIPHPLSVHPDWRVADGDGVPMARNEGYLFASPGNPEVRAWTAAVAGDIAGRYAVDGIHLDYIRYPGPGWSHDPVSEARYVQETADGGPFSGLSWADWQRAMVEDIVRRVRAAVDVPVTAAVWAIHSDVWHWGGVSEGSADYYQDSRAFLAEGLTDANIPMAYWPVAPVEGERLDFRVIARDHVAHAAGRHVYMGIGTYAIGEAETLRCIEAARAEGAQGVVLFSWSSVAGIADALRRGPFATPARPPPMPWRAAERPAEASPAAGPPP